MTNVFKLARSLVDGKLDLLCPKMELHHCRSCHEPVMTGCGQLRANEHGELSFRLSAEVPFPLPDVFRGDKPPGTVYEIDDHVMLVARDSEGRTWHSNPLLIHLNHPAEIFHGYLSRKIQTLSHRRELPSNEESRVEMYFPRQSRLPFDGCTTVERSAGEAPLERGWSLDHHSRKIGDVEVTFRQEDNGWLSVTGKQAVAIGPEWADLMRHALSFATSNSVRPAAIVTSYNDSEQIDVLTGPFRQYYSLLPRPIGGLTVKDAQPFWSLVEKFLLFTWKRRESPMQFLQELEAIRAGSTMSMQTACLTLSIGIEALANELLPSVPAVGWNPMAKASLESHIAAWEGDADVRARVLGWLRSNGVVRAQDRLYAWADANNIQHALIDGWSALRNRRAHGRALEDTQPSYDRYFVVVELLFRIVASVIGYAGPILETSKRGWGQGENEPKR